MQSCKYRSIALFACLTLLAGVALAQDPSRAITRISGDLYRFQNDFHFSVFLVTDEGVLVTDPINADAAAWLRDEIASRFGKPIRYVVYSHHHDDHVSGGEVFKQAGAVVIAHRNAVAGLESDNVPTASPDITFLDAMTITLGGRDIELKYLGRNHSDNSIVLLFPDERVLFAVDFVNVKRLPYRTISRSYFPDYFDSYEQLAGIDFDTIAPGHGQLGTKQDALDHGVYLKELHDQVRAGIDAGKSLDELKQSITMTDYTEWSQYDEWLPLNIEGMYNYLK